MKNNDKEDNKFTWGDSIIISKEVPKQFHPGEFGSICGFYKIKSEETKVHPFIINETHFSPKHICLIFGVHYSPKRINFSDRNI